MANNRKRVYKLVLKFNRAAPIAEVQKLIEHVERSSTYLFYGYAGLPLVSGQLLVTKKGNAVEVTNWTSQ